MRTKSEDIHQLDPTRRLMDILGGHSERKALNLKTASSLLIISNAGYCQIAVDQHKNAKTQA